MSEGLQVADLDFDGLVAREWITANGVGGYASSTVPGMNTRRYHGLLVAAMSPPVRRMVLLSRVEETLFVQGREHHLACNEYPGTIWPRGHEHLRAFSTDPFPRWGYQSDGWTLEKQVRLLKNENTVLISYTLWGGMSSADVELRPLLALRPIHELSYQWNGRLQAEPRSKGHWRVAATSRTPEVFFAHEGMFERRANWYHNTTYRREQERGYAGTEDLWCPGVARVRLLPGQAAYFACSADPIDLAQVVARAGRQWSPGSDVADVHRRPRHPPAGPRPRRTRGPGPALGPRAGRAGERRRLRVARPRHRPVHPLHPPGRVRRRHRPVPLERPLPAVGPGRVRGALPRGRAVRRRPLAAAVARAAIAGRLAAVGVPRGRVRATLPRGGRGPLVRQRRPPVPHLHRRHPDRPPPPARRRPADRRRLPPRGERRRVGNLDRRRRPARQQRPRLRRDVDGRQGRRLGRDRPQRPGGRGQRPLVQRAGHRVRPRPPVRPARARRDAGRAGGVGPRGVQPPVLERRGRVLLRRRQRRPRHRRQRPVGPPRTNCSPSACRSRCWPATRCCRRSGNCASWTSSGKHLLTPFGLRTLSNKDPGYQPHYGGNLHLRDRAYHNGTVFPWLLGPFVTAAARARGRSAAAKEEARALIKPCLDFLRGRGMGRLYELFDGNAPHLPGGAPPARSASRSYSAATPKTSSTATPPATAPPTTPPPTRPRRTWSTRREKFALGRGTRDREGAEAESRATGRVDELQWDQRVPRPSGFPFSPTRSVHGILLPTLRPRHTHTDRSPRPPTPGPPPAPGPFRGAPTGHGRAHKRSGRRSTARFASSLLASVS